MPQRCSFNICCGLSANLRLAAKASSERLFQGSGDATEMGLCFLDVSQEWQMGCRAQVGAHVQRTPATPGAAATSGSHRGYHGWATNTAERLCNDRNNSSYSLPHEKKLRMDRAGKHPVSLQACPKQNENKHLLTVQNGMLSCRAQAAPPLAPGLGLFCRSFCLP